jgi:hypothetical protein
VSSQQLGLVRQASASASALALLVNTKLVNAKMIEKQMVRNKLELLCGLVKFMLLILHHLHGRLSSRDVYGGYWREVTRDVIRFVKIR